MTNAAFDLGEEIKLHTLEFKLHVGLWNKFSKTGKLDLSISNWKSIKYLNTTATALHDDVASIPNRVGGLYLFTIKCDILPGITEFPVYIGRAQKTETQNLRKRCKEYFQKFAKTNERPLVTKMFKYWDKNIFLYYLPLATNHDIINDEKDLINSLLLPFNTEIPDAETKQATLAFP
ncbi:hypothetical protein M8998_03955 [Sphingobacterium sp. lm-10]|uniref:hypothetical protein n=1 Tax=Sphingobacterium sp. lm-10 TaxID=2944904 RepID=UPI0020204A7A|nr:hypothetical protein [Sphingobacterium sp. lm-10]MCL7987093.1 hypothetical protein [Sphingobacterium sp. lm-10]